MISLRLANQLLAGLPDNDYGILVTDLHVEYLDSGTVLFDISQTVTHAHFPAGAAVSLVVMMPHGQAAEAAPIGCEDAVGAVTSIVGRSAFSRISVQTSGPVFRANINALANARAVCPKLDQALHRDPGTLITQSFQPVACSRLHAIEPRLVRWLLMTSDRHCDGGDTAHLTREARATMLGSHRVSVVQGPAALETKRLIQRDSVRLIDRRASAPITRLCRSNMIVCCRRAAAQAGRCTAAGTPA
jgi:Crp-like helix-turn-helix protein